MHMSMGIDSTKFTRRGHARALRARAFCSSVAATIPRIFFWFGQITPDVEQHDRAEPRADADHHESRVEREGVDEVSLRSHAPPSQVASAAQRNQNRGPRSDVFRDAGAAGPPCRLRRPPARASGRR